MMPYNPCGRAVDFRRVPFLGVCKPFSDRQDEVEILWYPAAADAPALGFSSCMAVPNWDAAGQQWEGHVGMVPGAPQLFRNEKPRVIANYDHVCGSQADFTNGAVFDPDLPPVLYGVQGLPACCAAPVVPVGGAVVGGAADVGFIPVPTVVGGVVVGGDADVVFYPPGPPAGDDCETAPVIPLNVIVESEIADTDQQWWEFTSDGSHDYDVTVSGATDSEIALAARSGTCPGGLTPLTVTHSLGSDVWRVDDAPAGPVWLRITSTGFDGTYSFIITEV